MGQTFRFPYQDESLPVERRVADLLCRLTLEQKIAQLGCMLSVGGKLSMMELKLKNGIGEIGVLGGCSSAAENAEFICELQHYLMEQTEAKIPALIHIEAISGCALAEAQTFPLPLGLAAAFDPDKVCRMAGVIGRQMRAVGVRHALSPVMDIARDSRWGRVGETYGEDPVLSSAMSVAYVRGLQGDDLSGGCAATGKHFLGYSMSEGGLNVSASHLGRRELREVYAKPFEAAIRKADLAAVMNCYNEIDGEPIVSSQSILQGLLREELGFEGVTVSDYNAINRLYDSFNVAEDSTQAGAMALTAGVDIELPQVSAYGAGLRELVKRGDLDVAVIDRAVSRVLTLKFRLGLFEHSYPEPDDVNLSYHLPEQAALSYQLACESAVLLKNDGGLLPLKQNPGTIAVIGPNADSLRALFPSFTWPAVYELLHPVDSDGKPVENDLSRQAADKERLDIEELISRRYPGTFTVRQAVEQAFPESKVIFEQGCSLTDGGHEGIEAAAAAAGQADLAILVLGGKCGWASGSTSGEGIDTSTLELPGVQLDLLKAVYATGTPVILVHMDSRPLGSLWAAEHIPAILEVWHPGEAGGRAVADLLRGAVNPAGRLPMTAPRSVGQIPCYYGHKNGSGSADRGQSIMVSPNGYVNESGSPLFCFGHGLSYTHFDYTDLMIRLDEAHWLLHVGCTVKNSGSRDGDEVVQLYIRDLAASLTRPVKELAGFIRTAIPSGESSRVSFAFNLSQLAFLDKEMRWVTEAGGFEVQLGASCEDIRLRGKFELKKDYYIEKNKKEFYADAIAD